MIKRIPNLLLFAIVIISLYGCSSSRDIYTYDEINELIEQRFDDSLFAHAHWGVLIESLETGEIWYQRNSQ